VVLVSKHKRITLERLRELLHYDPETGHWKWVAKRPGVKAGAFAGTVNKVDGYLRIMIDGHLYLAQVLAWVWMTGEWPTDEVDHKDTDRSNGRWANLRLATHQQNQWNAGRRRNNTSGFKGVHWHPQHKKWQARLAFGGKRQNLGLYDCPVAAHFAVVIAADRHHGQFARPN
jgi:hypothetical protein